MRTLMLAGSAAIAMVLAGPAMAQHAPGHMATGGHWSGQMGGQWHSGGGQWRPHDGQWRWNGGGTRHGHFWGGSVNGHWIGGLRAPGGWGAYRRPVRGWTLPAYWNAPNFFIADWGYYDLAPPPEGDRWIRYYDDAVLADRYGRVVDVVSGLDWQDQAYVAGDYGYGEGYDYSHDVGPGAGYPPPPPPGAVPPPPPPVVAEAPPPPGARVERRVYRYEDAPPPPPVVVHQGYGCSSVCGGRVVGGWYYPPATTTTVTITSVPVTTTTTTYIEEEAAPVVHHVVRKAHVRPKRHWVKRHTVRCRC